MCIITCTFIAVEHWSANTAPFSEIEAVVEHIRNSRFETMRRMKLRWTGVPKSGVWHAGRYLSERAKRKPPMRSSPFGELVATDDPSTSKDGFLMREYVRGSYGTSSARKKERKLGEINFLVYARFGVIPVFLILRETEYPR